MLSFFAAFFRTRAALQLEILALRQQLGVAQQSVRRPRLKPADRILWAWLSRIWSGWDRVLPIVQPATVIRWRRRKFREHWAKLSRGGKRGRPAIEKEVRALIRRMSKANATWGAPRIAGELAKIGIDVGVTTVAKYMLRRRKPPSPTWRAFLKNHVKDLASLDFFIVPTVNFRVIFVLVILAHDRRRVVHFGNSLAPDRSLDSEPGSRGVPMGHGPEVPAPRP